MKRIEDQQQAGQRQVEISEGMRRQPKGAADDAGKREEKGGIQDRQTKDKPELAPDALQEKTPGRQRRERDQAVIRRVKDRVGQQPAQPVKGKRKDQAQAQG